MGGGGLKQKATVKSQRDKVEWEQDGREETGPEAQKERMG